MIKVLRVGDPHVTVKNLDESKALMDYAIKLAIEHKVSHVEILGDLFHSHAVVRLEVIEFWLNFFKNAGQKINIRVIPGNHDMAGSKELEGRISSLSVFSHIPGIQIMEKPTLIAPFLYVPYTSSESGFVAACVGNDSLGASCLVAHQTFQGASYENGFYAEDGFELSKIPQHTIISGHIHKSQTIGKCFYQGTAKWESLSDANEKKGLWIYTHDETGAIVEKTMISTEGVVTPIIKIELKEGDEIPKSFVGRTYVELVGSSIWIAQVKQQLKGMAQIKATPTDKKKNKPDKANILDLQAYFNSHFKPNNGILKEDIELYLKEV